MQQTRPQDNDSDWNTASGLPDDYDFDIYEAYFGFVDEYKDMAGNLQPLLIWEGRDRQGLDREREVFSIGSGWTIIDNGRQVAAPDADTPTRRKKFVASSIYGTLIDTMSTMGLREIMARRGSSRDARIWEGLSFHMKRVEIKYGGRLENRVRPMPVSYNGEIQVAARQASPTAAPYQVPVSTTVDKPFGGGVMAQPPAAEVSIVAELTEMARAMDLGQFQVEAMRRPEVYTNDGLRMAVVDAGTNGFWARARQQPY